MRSLFLFILIFVFNSCTYTKKKFISENKISYSQDVIIFTNIKHGEYRNYDLEGNLVEIANYSFNRLHGKYIQYYSNGNVHLKYNYKKNKVCGIMSVYYPNGNLLGVLEYYKNKLIFIHEYYDINGKKYDVDFENGNGKVQIYKNNSLIEEGNYNNGLKEGFWKYYSNTGHVDSVFFEKGKSKYHTEISILYLYH